MDKNIILILKIVKAAAEVLVEYFSNKESV